MVVGRVKKGKINMNEAECAVILMSEKKLIIDFIHDDYEVIHEDECKTIIAPFLGGELYERVIKFIDVSWLGHVVLPTVFISFYTKNNVEIEIGDEDYVETRVAEYRYC